MIAVHDRIIVRVDQSQKDSIMIGETKVIFPTKYLTNYREKSPVIAQVVDANDRLNAGDFLLCHHNHFHLPSPYFLQDDLFSIPANHTIFAIIRPLGELSPVYGNVLADKIEVETSFPVPAEYREFHKDRGLILDGGHTGFKTGDLVFTRPSAIYEIVYVWGDQERKVCKINSQMICAVIEKK